MALSAATLGAAMKAAAYSAPADTTGAAQFQAMAAAIINHIKANAVITVSVTSLDAAAGGVMAGASIATVEGTGTGTATIT